MPGLGDKLVAGLQTSKVYEKTNRLKLGFAWIDTKSLVPGSRIRRPGKANVESWKNELRGSGFGKEESMYISVYPDVPLEERDRLNELFGKLQEGIEGIPTAKAEDVAFIRQWAVLDGMHRSTAARELLAEAKTDEEKAPYTRVRALIMKREVVRYAAPLAKLLNFQSTKFVKEDNLAKLTFMQQMCIAYARQNIWEGADKEQDVVDIDYPALVKKLEARGLTKKLEAFYFEEMGGLDGALSKGKASTSGYVRQTITVAIATMGDFTTWCTRRLDISERDNNEVPHPTYMHLQKHATLPNIFQTIW